MTKFKIIDIHYTKNEKECIDNFKISKFNDFIYYGTIKINNLTEYLSSIGNNDIKSIIIIKNIIKKLSNIIIISYKTKYFQLIIRPSSYTNYIPS